MLTLFSQRPPVAGFPASSNPAVIHKVRTSRCTGRRLTDAVLIHVRRWTLLGDPPSLHGDNPRGMLWAESSQRLGRWKVELLWDQSCKAAKPVAARCTQKLAAEVLSDFCLCVQNRPNCFQLLPLLRFVFYSILYERLSPGNSSAEECEAATGQLDTWLSSQDLLDKKRLKGRHSQCAPKH